jgi:hypothetical protein
MNLFETLSSTNSSENKRKFFQHPNQLTIITGDGDNKRFESIPINNQSSMPIYYQDVGGDKNLQSDVTKFFQKKVLKWINKYANFKHLKKHYDFLKESSGEKYIYNMLRLFVKKSEANWYDLRDPQNYYIIKKYLNLKIANI